MISGQICNNVSPFYILSDNDQHFSEMSVSMLSEKHCDKMKLIISAFAVICETRVMGGNVDNPAAVLNNCTQLMLDYCHIIIIIIIIIIIMFEFILLSFLYIY